MTALSRLARMARHPARLAYDLLGILGGVVAIPAVLIAIF